MSLGRRLTRLERQNGRHGECADCRRWPWAVSVHHEGGQTIVTGLRGDGDRVAVLDGEIEPADDDLACPRCGAMPSKVYRGIDVWATV